jgi:hypothetical protein
VKVTLVGEQLDETGLLLDFKHLKQSNRLPNVPSLCARNHSGGCHAFGRRPRR